MIAVRSQVTGSVTVLAIASFMVLSKVIRDNYDDQDGECDCEADHHVSPIVWRLS